MCIIVISHEDYMVFESYLAFALYFFYFVFEVSRLGMVTGKRSRATLKEKKFLAIKT